MAANDVGNEIELTDNEDPRSLLIELIKNYPLLFDLSNSEYKIQSRKDRAWAEIASVIGMSSEDCQKAWKSLRDRYTRERRVNVEEVPSRWCFYDKMSFYARFTKPRTRFKFKARRRVKPEFLDTTATDEAPNTFSQEDSGYATPNTKIAIKLIPKTIKPKKAQNILVDVDPLQQEPTVKKPKSEIIEEPQNNISGSNRAFVEYLHCLLEEIPPDEAKEKRKQILLWMLE